MLVGVCSAKPVHGPELLARPGSARFAHFAPAGFPLTFFKISCSWPGEQTDVIWNQSDCYLVRGGSTLGHMGHVPPDSLVAPDSKASWPFWRHFWGQKMLQIPNFSGLRPRPRWRSLQRSPDPIADGEGLATPFQESHPRSRPFGSRFYRSQGLTHYRVGNPTNDRFQI